MPGTDDTGQDRRVFMRKTLDQDDTEVVALDPERVRALLAEEELAYDRRVPGSRELFARSGHRRHRWIGFMHASTLPW